MERSAIRDSHMLVIGGKGIIMERGLGQSAPLGVCNSEYRAWTVECVKGER
jgi:hypothetical protein